MSPEEWQDKESRLLDKIADHQRRLKRIIKGCVAKKITDQITAVRAELKRHRRTYARKVEIEQCE